MTRKIHLRRNKDENAAPLAACASNPYVAKARRNQRTTYQTMVSEIVAWKDFVNTPAADRCAHCVDAGLVIRNRQRAAKGLAPLASLFECTETLKKGA